MALVKCPNCGREISERAEQCPNCKIFIEDFKALKRVVCKECMTKYDAKFYACPKCGNPTPSTQRLIEKDEYGGLALALGIISIVVNWIPVFGKVLPLSRTFLI